MLPEVTEDALEAAFCANEKDRRCFYYRRPPTLPFMMNTERSPGIMRLPGSAVGPLQGSAVRTMNGLEMLPVTLRVNTESAIETFAAQCTMLKSALLEGREIHTVD